MANAFAKAVVAELESLRDKMSPEYKWVKGDYFIEQYAKHLRGEVDASIARVKQFQGVLCDDDVAD